MNIRSDFSSKFARHAAALVLGLLATAAIAQVPVTTAATLSPVTPTYSDTTTVTVTVTNGGVNTALTNPTGTVSYSVDGGSAGTATLASPLLGKATAYFPIPALVPGAHVLTYTYGGDGLYTGSAAQTVNFTVADRPLAVNGSQFYVTPYIYQLNNSGSSRYSTYGVSGVAVDPHGNEFLVFGSVTAGTAVVVKEIDASFGLETVPVSGLGINAQVASDYLGNLYFADPSNSRVVEYSTAGAQTILPLTGLQSPAAILYDQGSNSLYLLDTTAGKVIQYNLATQTQTTRISGLSSPLAVLAYDGIGSFYYAQKGTLYQYTSNGVSVPIYGEFYSSYATPSGLAFNSATGDLWVNSYLQGGSIVRIDASHHASVVALTQSGQIALDAYGTLYTPLTTVNTGPAARSGPGAETGLAWASLPYGRVIAQSYTQPTSPGLFGSVKNFSVADTVNPGIGLFQYKSSVTLDNGAQLIVPVYGIDFSPYPATSQGVIAPLTGVLNFATGTSPAAIYRQIGGVAYVDTLDAAAGQSTSAFVSDSTQNTVTQTTFNFSPVSLNPSPAVSTRTTLGFTGLNHPTQLTADGAFDVFVLDQGDTNSGGRITELDYTGKQTTLYTASAAQRDQLLDTLTTFTVASDGLYAGGKESEASQGSIIRIDANGIKYNVAYTTGIPQAIAVDGFRNVFSVDDSGALVETDRTGRSTTIATGLPPATSISLDASDTVYLATSSGTAILSIRQDGTKISLPLTGVANPATVAVDFYGDLYVGDNTTNQLFVTYRQQANLNFGTVATNSTTKIPDTITNVGNLSLPEPFTATGGNVSGNYTPYTVAAGAAQPCQLGSTVATLTPGQNCSVVFQYAPTKAETDTATITATSAPFSAFGFTNTFNVKWNLTGKAIAATTGSLSISPVSLSFGPTVQGQSSATQTSTITNTTSQAIYLSSGSLTDSTDYKQTDNCNGLIAANTGSCTVTFTFTPQTMGGLNSTYSIHDLNTPNAMLTVSLAGIATATPGVLTVTPNPVVFPNQTVNTTNTGLSVTLKNTGNSNLSLGTTIGTVGGTDATAFSLAGSTCGYTLTPGSSCTVTLTFTPNAARTFNATFTVPSSDPNSPAVVPLTGTGVVAAAPQASLTPQYLNFTATAGTPTAAQPATLTNTGNATLNISSIALSGTGANSFTETTTCGATLAATASCTISVAFNPSAPGSYSASLIVMDNAAGSTQASLVTGTASAAPAPQAALSPSTQSFGSVTANTTASKTFTLTNAGNATLSVTSITLSGPNATLFAIATNTCGNSLAATSSCSITINFTPTTTVSAGATLAIVDAVGTQTSALTGSSPTATPTAGDFTLTTTPPSQSSYHGASVSYSISVANVNAASPFTGVVTLSSANPPSGITVSFSPATLMAGGSSTMTVTIPALVAAHIPLPPGSHAPLETTLAGVALAALLIGRRRRKLPALMLMLLALGGLALTITGCSTTGNGFAIPTTTSTITVTGTSGTTVHTTTVSLTIQ